MSEKILHDSDVQNILKRCGAFYPSSNGCAWDVPVFYRSNPAPALLKLCTSQNAKFRDPSFPPEYASLEWTANRNKFFSTPNLVGDDSERLPPLRWSRLRDLTASHQQPAIFKRGSDCCDLVQGSLNDCWLLSTIAGVATLPQAMTYIFEPCPEINDQGVYCLRLFVMGEWLYMVLDDFVPVMGRNVAFGRSADPSEMWVCLLEKAFAKWAGSYGLLQQGGQGQWLAMHALTGAVSHGFNTLSSTAADLWLKLHAWLDAGYIVVARPKFSIKGLMAPHAYTIVSAVEIGCTRLVKLQNAWGVEAEWTGDWCRGSELWSQQKEVTETVHFDVKDSGFFMSVTDFYAHFGEIQLCGPAKVFPFYASRQDPMEVEDYYICSLLNLPLASPLATELYETALRTAATTGDFRATHHALQRGAMPTVDDLHTAISNGATEVVRLLLEAGVNLRAVKDDTYPSSLCLAAHLHPAPVLLQLLADYGDNPLKGNLMDFAVGSFHGMESVRSWCVSAVLAAKTPTTPSDRILSAIEAAKSVGIPESEISTINPLLGRTGILVATRAAARGDDALLDKCFSEFNVNVDCRDDNGLTPLHYAANNNHPECLKVCISAHSNINVRSAQSQTALHLCARQNQNTNSLKLLLAAGADPFALDKDGMSLLELAEQGGVNLVIEACRAAMGQDRPTERTELFIVASESATDITIASLFMQPKSGTEGDSQTASAVTEWRSSQTAPHSWISIEINTIKPAAVDRIVLHVSDSDRITAARVYANDTRLVGQAEHYSNDICSVRWMVPVQSRRWRIEMRVPESGIVALRRVQLFAGAKEITTHRVHVGESVRIASRIPTRRRDPALARLAITFAGELPEPLDATNPLRGVNGEQIALRAAQAGRSDILRIVFDAGVSPDCTDEKRRCPLYISVLNEDYACAKMCLDYGAVVHLWSMEDMTPILVAAAHNKSQRIMCLLLAAGANHFDRHDLSTGLREMAARQAVPEIQALCRALMSGD